MNNDEKKQERAHKMALLQRIFDDLGNINGVGEAFLAGVTFGVVRRGQLGSDPENFAKVVIQIVEELQHQIVELQRWEQAKEEEA